MDIEFFKFNLFFVSKEFKSNRVFTPVFAC